MKKDQKEAIQELLGIYEKAKPYLSDNIKSAFDYFQKETDDWTNFDSISDNPVLYDAFKLFLSDLEKIQIKDKKGYSGRRWEGKLYSKTSGIGAKEIAKLMREELKIQFPEAKFSVKIDGGQYTDSIDIKILDPGFNPFTEKYSNWLEKGIKLENIVEAYIKESGDSGARVVPKPKKWNLKFLKMVSKVTEIHDQYNYDDSDPMTDYFSRGYYGNVYYGAGMYLGKYYPKHPDHLEELAYQKELAERDQRRKAKADEAKKSILFKKGEVVRWKVKFRGKDKEEMRLVVINKAPNGRSRVGSYYNISDLKEAKDTKEVAEAMAWDKKYPRSVGRHYAIGGKSYIRYGSGWKNITQSRLFKVDDKGNLLNPPKEESKSKAMAMKLKLMLL